MSSEREARYQPSQLKNGVRAFRDVNLERFVSIYPIAHAARENVRTRLSRLQAIDSPYLALIYDLLDDGKTLGVIEELLTEPVSFASDDSPRRLLELCSALAALHEAGLAHGNLAPANFRTGPLGSGRLCNLSFDARLPLSDPAIDSVGLWNCIANASITLDDPVWSELVSALARNGLGGELRVALFRDRLAALILRDQHRALAYWKGRTGELGALSRTARFVHPMPGVASIQISYDGTRFFVGQFGGEVKINNISPRIGESLPGSCVIALGDSHRPFHERYFITFDQSHPEVG